MSAEPRHRHHHKRRYRVAPQALGDGYDTYDVPEKPVFPAFSSVPAPTSSATAELAEPATEVLSEKERRQRSSRRGMWICAGILLALLAGMRFNWVFEVYAALVRAWQYLVNLINARPG